MTTTAIVNSDCVTNDHAKTELSDTDFSKAALLECMPPSERDLDAFRLIRGEQKSTREVAKLLRISQTRVRQVVDRVADYLLRLAPGVKDPARQNQRLYLAEALGLERMRSMYREAMRSFRRSRGQQTIITETPGPLGGTRAVSRTMESQGDVKYLQSAMRISWLMAKVPDNQLLNSAYALLDDEEEGDDERESTAAGQATVNPLNGDCSASRSSDRFSGGSFIKAIDANDDVDEPYDNAGKPGQDDGSVRFTPAHPAGLGSKKASLDGEPEAIAAPREPRRPLNRHERRARQRKLAKAKRK